MFEPTIAAVAQGEPVAWRLNHGNGFFSEFTTGVPTEVAKAHWKRMGVTIEYAYLHPAPAGAQEPVGELKAKHGNTGVFVQWYKQPQPGDKLYTAPPAVAVNKQLFEALKELMYARTDKAEGMADAAIAQAEAAKGGCVMGEIADDHYVALSWSEGVLDGPPCDDPNYGGIDAWIARRARVSAYRCQFCGGSIGFINRKPYNLADGTAHTCLADARQEAAEKARGRP